MFLGAGADTHPSWFFNLRSKPQVSIQIKDKTLQVRAEIAPSEERQALWDKLVKIAPSYAAYEKRTTREIPIVLLYPEE